MLWKKSYFNFSGYFVDIPLSRKEGNAKFPPFTSREVNPAEYVKGESVEGTELAFEGFKINKLLPENCIKQFKSIIGILGIKENSIKYIEEKRKGTKIDLKWESKIGNDINRNLDGYAIYRKSNITGETEYKNVGIIQKKFNDQKECIGYNIYNKIKENIIYEEIKPIGIINYNNGLFEGLEFGYEEKFKEFLYRDLMLIPETEYEYKIVGFTKLEEYYVTENGIKDENKNQYVEGIIEDTSIKLVTKKLEKPKSINYGVNEREEFEILIEESKEIEELFYKIIDELKEEDILLVKNSNEKAEILKKTFEYFEENKISLSDFTSEIRYEFDKKTRSININDDKELANNQILINSLESKNNEIRVIFAVNKLDEGWDVLNLFDIVRVAENRGNTLSEAQLIGRGARYYPFKIDEDDEKYKRKYDNSKTDLKYIEQLHYHSINESNYISELKTELEKSGIFVDDDKRKEINLKVKNEIKITDFYVKGKIFVNEKVKRDKKEINRLEDIFKTRLFDYKLYGSSSNENQIFDDKEEKSKFYKEKRIFMKDISENIVRTAINKNLFYKFDNLKKYIPNLKSINEFIVSENYLANMEIKLIGETDQLNNLLKEELLKACIKTLNDIEVDIKNNLFDYEGTRVFKPKAMNKILVDKTLNIIKDSEKTTPIDVNLINQDWYVYNEAYGTTEEKALVKFVYNFIEELEEKYEDIKLMRNEKLFQIYNFKNGDAFEPDFVLFLKEKDNTDYLYYQLFIEPKGEQLFKLDKWKEDFLEEINQMKEIKNIFENDKYIIYGLPFFNKDAYEKNSKFEEEFKKITKLELKVKASNKNTFEVREKEAKYNIFSEKDKEVIEMLKDNLDDDKIIKYTKISKKRLKELKQEIFSRPS